jgi:hypothetical protein
VVRRRGSWGGNREFLGWLGEGFLGWLKGWVLRVVRGRDS